jgi:hypothetical protein
MEAVSKLNLLRSPEFSFSTQRNFETEIPTHTDEWSKEVFYADAPPVFEIDCRIESAGLG